MLRRSHARYGVCNGANRVDVVSADMPLIMVPGLTQEVQEAGRCVTPEAACETVQAAALSAACATQVQQVRPKALLEVRAGAIPTSRTDGAESRAPRPVEGEV